MGTARLGAAAAPLPGGQVLVAGGHDGSNPLMSAELFDPATGGFSATGSMGTPRIEPAVAPLADGRALVMGGSDGSIILPSDEAYDPATGSFSTAGLGAMQKQRQAAAAAPLPGGKVLVAGGYDGSTEVSSAEIFDPGTGNFSYTGSMGTARSAAVAAPLPGGKVLVAGGYNLGDGALSSAEVFDPATDTFSSAGIRSMSVPRRYAAAAPLPDGRVLVMGGDSGGAPNLASAEVFDPATNSFSSAGIGSMSTPRADAAAAALADGRVLVAGGLVTFLPTASAEIFSLAKASSPAPQGSPSNAFGFRLRGRRLIVSVQASGKVSLSDAASPLKASKKKRKLRLKPSSAGGDPPTITVPLRLTKLAKRKLRQKGKVAVKARITFTPQGGLANTQRAKLKIKGKRRKKR